MSAAVARQTPPSFAPAPSGFVPAPPGLLQRACACGGSAGPSGSCSSCDSETRFGIQPKLTVNRPGDLYEQEADRIADAVVGLPDRDLDKPSASPDQAVQRKVTPIIQRREAESAGPDDVELQRRSEGGVAIDAEHGFRSRLTAARGGGAPLERALRRRMEQRFGVDLGHVRIHTGSGAAALARDINAQAFTLGSDVYFGEGYYDPASRRGRHLLAHELVHTLQQRRGAVRPASHDTTATSPGEPPPAEATVQRNPVDSFVPANVVRGTSVHKVILAAFGRDNRGLFTEVNIPGATRLGPAEKAGRADLYMDATSGGADRTGSTVPGVIMIDGTPRYLPAHRELRKGGARFGHKEQSAPRARDTIIEGAKRSRGGSKQDEASCDGLDVDVCRIDQAPRTILLGDLKPPPGLKNYFDGTIQLNNYDRGLRDTSAGLNRWIGQNPDRAAPRGAKWKPKTGRLSDLAIPAEWAIDSPTAPVEGLRVYDGSRNGPTLAGLTGKLAVYKAEEAGIWNYEWIPDNIPAQLTRRGMSPQMQGALMRLNALVTRVRSPDADADTTVKRKVLAKPRRGAGTGLIQRKEGFDAATWPGEFKDWQTQNAEPLLGSKAIGPLGKAGTVSESSEVDEIRVLEAAREVKERIPAAHQPAALRSLPPRKPGTEGGLKRLRFWARWGGLIGRLRSVLGKVFVKIASLYETAKAKIAELLKKDSPEGEEKAGGIVGAIIAGAFKVAKTFFGTLVHRVADNLKLGLKNAATIIIKGLIGEDRVAAFEDAEAAVEEKVRSIEERVEAAIQKIKDFAEPILKIFRVISNVKQWLGDVKKLIAWVRWGLRIVQCLTPPGLGCLKLIVQELAEELAAKVIASCWFTTHFIRPVFKAVKFFRTLPNTISDFILDKIKWLVGLLPIDQALVDQAFARPQITGDVSDADLGCDDKTITAAQIEMNNLLDQYGRDEVLRMIRLLEASGLNDSREMTHADVAVVRGLLDKVRMGEVTEADIESAIATLKRDPHAATIGSIDTMLDQMSGLAASGGERAGAGAGPGAGPGGGGATGKDAGSGGGSGVTQLTFEQARGDGKGKAGKVAGSWIRVVNEVGIRKVGERVTIDLLGELDKKPVVLVTGVPATIVEVREETLAGKPVRRAVYRVDAEVVLRHRVVGKPPFGTDPSRPIGGHAFSASTPAPALVTP